MNNINPFSQERAREILGKNFFGVQAWSTLYGVSFSQEQLQEVAELPWGEEIFNASCPFVDDKTIKETHFIFLGLNTVNGNPLNILNFHELNLCTGQQMFYYSSNPWYKNHAFAVDRPCGFRWYLMPLEMVPNSTNKTFEEQVAMLPPEYEVPYAIEETMKDILYYRRNGIYLNPNKWGRCQDVLSDGSRVSVGRFGPRGLFVNHYWGNGSGLGLAASRKLPAQITR